MNDNNGLDQPMMRFEQHFGDDVREDKQNKTMQHDSEGIALYPMSTPLVAEFGNVHTRKKRDVFMQWILPFARDYGATRKHSEKEAIATDVIRKWVDMNGTFVVFSQQQNPRDPIPLSPSNANDRETIGVYIKQKLAKMAKHLEETFRDNQDEESQATVSTSHPTENSPSPSPPISPRPMIKLVARFGNTYTRKKRDAYMQWLEPSGQRYGATNKYSEKERIASDLINKWIAMGGTFHLCNHGILDPTDSSDRKMIGFYTKQKLSRMASQAKGKPKKVQSKGPKLDLLITILDQEAPE